MYLNLGMFQWVVVVVAIDLNRHHHLRKDCSEQGLVQNGVEDSLSEVHHDEVEFELAVVFLYLRKLASMLQ
jgi:hypothetical protein